MKVYGIFHGGSSYSTYWTNQDVEEFATIQAAKNALESRHSFDPFYPCVDESASFWLFFEDPRNTDLPKDSLIDPGYPDRVLEVGKRGGIVCSSC